jgi:hypothetical protein
LRATLVLQSVVAARASVLVGIVGLLGALAPREDPELRSVREYRDWKPITPKPVDMAPVIAVSCVGPGKLDREPNPHIRAAFRVYVNKKGERAMASDGQTPFPVGSIIVKEKFDRDPDAPFSPPKIAAGTKPDLLTVMIKRKRGYAPADGDWQYAVLEGDAKKPTTAGLKHCASCHRAQKARDYVFREYGSIRHGG